MCRATASPRHASTSSSSVPCTTSPGHVIPRACCVAASRSITFVVPAGEAQKQRLGVGLERPAHSVLDLLRGVRLGEDLAEEELGVPAPVTEPVVAVLLGPPLVRVEHLVERVRDRLRHESATWRAGAISISAATRSGCSAARMRDSPRSHHATTTARLTPAASSAATASPAYSRRAYSAPVRGRSERPLPRGSNVTTVPCRARYGIWHFQERECTISQVGSRRNAGDPPPYRSQWTRTPSRSTNPCASGYRARVCSVAATFTWSSSRRVTRRSRG